MVGPDAVGSVGRLNNLYKCGVGLPRGSLPFRSGQRVETVFQRTRFRPATVVFV